MNKKIWDFNYNPLQKIPWFHLISWCGIFCGKAQFLRSFERITWNYMEALPFHKISTTGNLVKLRYFTCESFEFLHRKSENVVRKSLENLGDLFETVICSIQTFFPEHLPLDNCAYESLSRTITFRLLSPGQLPLTNFPLDDCPQAIAPHKIPPGQLPLQTINPK